MKPVEDWRTDFDHLEWRWVEDPPAIWADLPGNGTDIAVPQRQVDAAVALSVGHRAWPSGATARTSQRGRRR
jgi:hypothetical protein